jgi:hypothetical protein
VKRARAAWIASLATAAALVAGASRAAGGDEWPTALAQIVDHLAAPEGAAYEASASGFVTDASHPRRPGDFYRAEVTVRIRVHPALGEASIEVESGEGDAAEVDRYFVRRGRIFQVEEGDAAASDTLRVEREVLASSLGDLAAATVAALHPALVAGAMDERRDAVVPRGQARADDGGAPRVSGSSAAIGTLDPTDYLFAWNDELWTVTIDPERRHIAQLARRTYHDLLGDGVETIRYEEWPDGPDAPAPRRVVVTHRGRETARLEFGETTRSIAPRRPGDPAASAMPSGDRERDRARLIDPSEVAFREVAPRLFAADIASQNTRVMVAEFADHVVVLEGVYNSRNCDRVARRVRERFAKPVRYFSFSHLHGQYIGGVRSWVHDGATVIVPPTTVPLVEEIMAGAHDLRPDALSREPKPLRVETVERKRTLADDTNALEIYNVVSEHTDEYFFFYFPRQRLLMTGDLLFYRPGQPLRGRSKRVCQTVRELGLDVATFYATWPLDGYGTKAVVTAEEFWEACAKSE